MACAIAQICFHKKNKKIKKIKKNIRWVLVTIYMLSGVVLFWHSNHSQRQQTVEPSASTLTLIGSNSLPWWPDTTLHSWSSR